MADMSSELSGLVTAEHVAATRNALNKKHLTNVKRMADRDSVMADADKMAWVLLLQAPLP